MGPAVTGVVDARPLNRLRAWRWGIAGVAVGGTAGVASGGDRGCSAIIVWNIIAPNNCVKGVSFARVVAGV